MNAVRTVSRRLGLDLALQTGIYIAFAIQCAVTIYIQWEFARSVGTVGIDTSASTVFELLTRAIRGTYGDAAIEHLLARGPQRLSIWIGALFPTAYIVVHSILSIGAERRSGFLELVMYSPIRRSSYVFAGMMRDAIALTGVVLIGALSSLLGALSFNLAIDASIAIDLLTVFGAAAIVLLYAAIIAEYVDHATASIPVLLAVIVFFVVLHLGRAAIVVDEVAVASRVIGAILQWVSPLFYARVITSGARAASAVSVVAGIGGYVALGAILGGTLHLSIRRRGDSV
jgi:hypothetical protein